MRISPLVMSALLVVAIAVLDAQPPSSTAMLVKAGRVLDLQAGAYRADQGIWIEGGRIRQVGAFDVLRAAAPDDIRVVDLGRGTVLPGLIDCHAHLLDAMDPAAASSDNLILAVTKDPPTRRALLGAAMARETLGAGFTTVRNVGHSGIDGDVSLRDAIRSGWVPGPRIVAAARKIAPHGGQGMPIQSGVAQALIDQEFLPVGTPDEGRRAVLENLRVGADVIKVVADDWPRVIGEDTLRAIVDEAHRVSVRVAAHATTKLGVQVAIAAGVDSIEHGDEATDDQFRLMRTKGIFFVPTVWPREMLPVPRAWSTRPDIDAIKDKYLAGERLKLEHARQAGVKIAFGSDVWFGYPDKTRGEATRLVLEALQTFGMTALDVIRAATVTAADLLNVGTGQGAVEPGKYADLIAVEGDPLANVRDLEKVTFVMKDGAVVRDDIHPGRSPSQP
jgi:imidazolonepropionase-like amidohydrolase